MNASVKIPRPLIAAFFERFEMDAAGKLENLIGFRDQIKFLTEELGPLPSHEHTLNLMLLLDARGVDLDTELAMQVRSPTDDEVQFKFMGKAVDNPEMIGVFGDIVILFPPDPVAGVYVFRALWGKELVAEIPIKLSIVRRGQTSSARPH